MGLQMAKWVPLMAPMTPGRPQYSLKSRILSIIRAPRGQLISLRNSAFTATTKSFTIQDMVLFPIAKRFAHMKQRGSLDKFVQRQSYLHQDRNSFPIRGVLPMHVKGQYVH